MHIGADTTRLLAELDQLSGGRLKRREDLGILLELGAHADHRSALGDLGFSAKFLARAHGMMQRIGPGGEGYDRLSAEFSSHLEKVSMLLRSILRDAPDDVRSYFSTRYLSLTPEGLGGLLELCHDLGWYKNRLIDAGRGPRGAAP